MSFPPVAITGLGLWVEGFPNTVAWRGGSADPAATKPAGQALDKVNRRRAGPLGRGLADVIAEAVAMAGVDAATVPTVIGSAIGEASTMTGLLDAMWRHGLPMSPAEFTVSVHNAAAGLISISNKNRGMTTSLAADDDTPAAALLEAIGLVVTRDAAVVVACADEPAPPTLAQVAPPWALLAAAVVLEPLRPERPALAALTLEPQAVSAYRGERFGELLRSNPQIGLGWLVDAVLHGHRGAVPLDRGTGRGYAAVLAPGSMP
ncbi:MAG: beta-ketoacyl synthase chain length factor [Planctomycetes bacterium]|nr:beta-ketoacyl synthase chain length factor [Planctomycetota bacterium]